jgi:hypothetical protein
MDLAMRAGVLYAMLKQHWVDYIGAKMRECPYPGGQPRKRYLYKACADYRFEFSQ